MKTYYTLILLGIFVFTSFIVSQDDKSSIIDGWKIQGHLQVRAELDGRDFLNETFAQTYTNFRTRIGIEKTLLNKVSLFIQLQDSRMFGEPNNTTSSISSTDLHQGYAIIKNIFDIPLSVKVGRYEMSYGISTRYIGSNQWNYNARAWDGVTVAYKTEKFKIDAWANTHNQWLDYRGGPKPSTYVYPNLLDEGFNMYGLWATMFLNEQNRIDLFEYIENNRSRSINKTDPNLNRFTQGLNYYSKIKDFELLIEAAYQFGKIAATKIVDTNTIPITKDVSAYRLVTELKYNFNPMSIKIGTDISSGTKAEDDATKYNNYTQDFGSRHSFNGYMNYFSDLRASTGGRGLNDLYLFVNYAPKNNPFSAEISGHYFMSNQPYIMPDKSENTNLGSEVDLLIKYNIIKGTSVEWGASAFFSGDIYKQLYTVKNTDGTLKVRDDMGFWSFIMVRVNI